MTMVVNDSLPEVVRWPTEEEFARELKKNSDLPAELKDIVCIVDGTRFPISMPTDQKAQRPYYSGKSKSHNITALFVTLMDGTPIYVSPTMPGSWNDQGLWNE